MEVRTEGQDEPIKQPDPVAFYIALMPFEREIISQLQVQLDRENHTGYNAKRYPVSRVFEEWTWAKLIKSAMKDDLGHDGEYLMKDYGGNRVMGYNSLLHFLTHTGGGPRNLARVQQLRSINDRFLPELGNRTIEDVKVQPWPNDLALWQTISVMWQHCGQYWNFVGILGHYGGFVILELIRKFTIQWKWDENVDLVDQTLLQSPRFETAYNVQRTLVGLDQLEDMNNEQIPCFKFEECRITKKLDRKKLPKRDGEIPKTDNGALTIGDLTYPVDDPRSYVHFIPWTELTSVSDEELRRSGIIPDIPFSTSTRKMDSWVVWSPPFPGFAWNHHFHSEDEVYQYHVVNDWALPDHYVGHRPSKILFRVCRLDETEFVADLGQYWEAWNDCALTTEVDTGDLLLLETVPGMRYRGRRKHQDETAAREYCRNVVEAHANGSLDQPVLAQLAGMDATQILQFQHSLRFITEAEFVCINWKSPLGTGQNGRVFTATWKKPRGVLVTPSEEKDVLDVVLKEVIPHQGSAGESLKKLLKELYLAYISLGAKPTACVDFLGIARFSGTKQEHERHSPTTMDRYYLVFERATERSFIGFLENKLKGDSFFQAWDSIIQAMSSIASGLDTLHKHNVMHRDLHDENILVTLRQFPNDPINPFEYQYMLSDIGEGKMLTLPGAESNPPDAHYASYGNPYYRAPEVSGPSGWTKAADLWSFGMICIKLLEMRRSLCGAASNIPSRVFEALREQHPDGDFSHSSRDLEFIVPLSLKQVLEPCFRHDPNERPDIHAVALGLDEITLEFYVDDKERLEQDVDVKWSYWNWNETRVAGLKGKKPVMGAEDDLDLDQDVIGELDLDDVPNLD